MMEFVALSIAASVRMQGKAGLISMVLIAIGEYTSVARYENEQTIACVPKEKSIINGSLSTDRFCVNQFLNFESNKMMR